MCPGQVSGPGGDANAGSRVRGTVRGPKVEGGWASATYTWCSAEFAHAAFASAARFENGDLLGRVAASPSEKRSIFLSLSRNSILERMDLYSTPLE